MIADLVIDFESHLKHNKVWLVQIDLPLQDAPEDVPSSITADVYVIASNRNQAVYIAQSMYPDCFDTCIGERPVTEYEYAARRNRSIL
jgi:hypothetical protein